MRHLPLRGILAVSLLSLAGAGPFQPGPDPAPPPALAPLQCTSRLDGTSLVRQCTSHEASLILITTPDGRSTLAATVNGMQVYNGPYTTPEERAKVSPEISLQLRLAIIREKADITDSNEWAVMSQKIRRVLEVQDLLAQAVPADMLSYSREVPAPANPDNKLAVQMESLAKGLSPNTPDADRKTLITASRDARRKLADQLQSARRDLLNVSTVRQEAIFIHLGILE